MKYKVGHYITFSEGSYSDYHLKGTFIVLKEFDQGEIVDKFKKEFVVIKTVKQDYRGKDYVLSTNLNSESFMNYLTQNEYITDADNHHEWYMGDYVFEPEVT